MIRKISIGILLFLQFTLSQTNYSQIKGKVIGSDKSPIERVNVYLSGTTFGSSTNNAGEFFITKIPSGKYILVISAIGYKNQQYEIVIKPNKMMEDVFVFEKEDIELKEILVKSKKPDKWFENLDIFKEQFLGEDDFASFCEIINQEYLDFVTFEDTLFCQCKVPIEIINNKLGYKLFVELREFKYDMQNEFLFYQADVKFEEFISKKTTYQEIKENREEIFIGSPKHFFQSLTHSSNLKYKFAYSIGDPEILQSFNSGILKKFISTDLDHLEVQQHDKFFFKLKLKKAIKVYLENHIKNTILIPIENTIYFDKLGNIMNSDKVYFHGYWDKYRMAKTLPKEFSY